MEVVQGNFVESGSVGRFLEEDKSKEMERPEHRGQGGGVLEEDSFDIEELVFQWLGNCLNLQLGDLDAAVTVHVTPTRAQLQGAV